MPSESKRFRSGPIGAARISNVHTEASLHCSTHNVWATVGILRPKERPQNDKGANESLPGDCIAAISITPAQPNQTLTTQADAGPRILHRGVPDRYESCGECGVL